jgi:hypothetical protein
VTKFRYFLSLAIYLGFGVNVGWVGAGVTRRPGPRSCAAARRRRSSLDQGHGRLHRAGRMRHPNHKITYVRGLCASEIELFKETWMIMLWP